MNAILAILRKNVIGTNCSPNHKKQALNGRVARKKPFINMRNRKLRLEFAVNRSKKDESGKACQFLVPNKEL